MRAFTRIALAGLALCLLLIAACASAPPEKDQAAPPAPKASASGLLPATPPGPAERICLWVFWTDNSTLMKEARSLLDQGQPFQTIALTMARDNKGYVTTQADCLPRAQLPPAMDAAVKDLKLGQVSRPFALNSGQALAMLTSDAFRRQAKELYEQGKYKQAIEQLKLDLELHPAAAASWHLMALCHLALGDKAAALKAYDQALEWTPGDPAVLNDKATLLAQTGQGDQAVVLYRRALAAKPQDPVFMNNLAWALVHQKGDLNEALALAQEAVRLSPENPAVWDTLGQVQQARGDHAAAVVSFHHAARLDPKSQPVQERMLGSLLALKAGQVNRLAADGAPPVPAPQAKPAPAPQAKAKPKAKPKPKPAPAPAPKAAPKPEPAPAPAPRPAPKPEPAPRPRPAPAPKPASVLKPVPAPAPVLKLVPAPTPAPQAAVAPMAKPAPQAKAPAQDMGRPPRGWFLQLSSNRKADLALKARASWSAKGHDAHVWAWRSPKSGLWHRLLLGPFTTKTKALVRGDMLKQAGELKTYVLIRVP